jgi:biopolymer transport protein ExbB/TolQ
MTADSLQAASDTLVVVQSNSWLDWASFVASVFIAGFTGGYLWYTTKIFRQTKKQAESAEESAEASREAAKATKDSLEEQRRVVSR